MASESMNAKQARNHFTKGKKQQQQQVKNKSSVSDGAGEDSFIFEANEAWKDFHSSLLRFYENGELCDVTLKKINTSLREERGATSLS
uniref:Kelch like family member 8 n=1 Tax=Equus caballus TaxID=9796 RepID=A0A9L0RXT5_HORSE